MHTTIEALQQTACQFGNIEGSSDAAEQTYLSRLAASPSVKTIGEIGFNAGLSSCAFLQANSEAHVYSFDLGEHPYIFACKQRLDAAFPNRHTLVAGDSAQTVPQFRRDNPDVQFDLIFIDGGHSFAAAWADLTQMRLLAAPNATVILDDLVPWYPWGIGPTRAWRKALREGLIMQTEKLSNGKLLFVRRCWATGVYTANH